MNEPYSPSQSVPHPQNAPLVTPPLQLSTLLSAWEHLDRNLESLHQDYALKAYTLDTPKASPSQRKPSVIKSTAMYSAILTPPSITTENQSLAMPVDRNQSLSQEILDVDKKRSALTSTTTQRHLAEREEEFSAPSSRQYSSLRSRESFTSQSHILEPVHTNALVSDRHQDQTARDLSASTASRSGSSGILDAQAQPRLIVDGLIDPSASDAELQEFTSVAERLMQAQERAAEGVYSGLDSTQPAPLDDLYESITPNFPSIVSRPVSFVETSDQDYNSTSQASLTSLHIIKAPEPLMSSNKTSWGKLILVSLVSLMIGGAIAHFLLQDLIRLLGVIKP